MHDRIPDQLNALGVRRLRVILAELRGGSIGFDCDRHPVCKTKDGLIGYIIEHGNADESAPAPAKLAAFITGETPATAPHTPAASGPVPVTADDLLTPRQSAPAPADRMRATDDPNDGRSVKRDAAERFAAALADIIPDQRLDETAVREMVRAEIAARVPLALTIKTEQTAVTMPAEYRHPLFPKVLRLVAAGLNVMMVGPAGSGKTTIAQQVAQALGRPFASISLTAGASESQLLGRYLPTGDAGRFEYSDTPFMRMYEQGGVFLLDEFDAADPNMAIILNQATSNGHFFNDYRRDAAKVTRHDNAIILAAANTYGTGTAIEYAGRNQLDAATLDRFYIVHIGYDEALDRLACGMTPDTDAKPWTAAKDPTPADLADLGSWSLAVRRMVAEKRLHRVFSPRATLKAVTARKAGIPTAEIKADLLAGWTRDELTKLETLAPRELMEAA